MEHNPALKHLCIAVQVMVLQGWVAAGSMCPASASVLSVMSTSIVGPAKRYSVLALQMFKQVQKQGRKGRACSLQRTDKHLPTLQKKLQAEGLEDGSQAMCEMA